MEANSIGLSKFLYFFDVEQTKSISLTIKNKSKNTHSL